MVEETNKRNYADYLIIAMVVIFFLSEIIYKTTGYFSVISFICFCSLFIATGIVAPVNNSIKNGTLKNRTAILLIAVRAVLIVVFLISVYEILLSKNYNLRYTYWIAAISISLTVFIYFIQLLTNDYRRRKAESKRHSVLYIISYTVLLLLLWGFEGFNTAQSFFHPKHQIALDNLKVPNKIAIYKYSKNEKGKGSLNLYPVSEISSPEDIKKITNDLESVRIINLSFTSLINYTRMRDDSCPYYIMQFQYDTPNGISTKLENGYIEDIVVTTNRNTAIEELSKRGRVPFIWQFYTAIYPVRLSEGTTDMIFGYLK